jgi:hypothetical protein
MGYGQSMAEDVSVRDVWVARDRVIEALVQADSGLRDELDEVLSHTVESGPAEGSAGPAQRN